MMKITRRTFLFAFLLFFAACAGLSVLLAPDDVEPVAEVAAPAVAAT